MDEKGNTQILEAIDEPAPDDRNGRTYLIVLAGGIPGSMLPLAAGINLLGRGPENTIVLPEASVSRRHAEIKLDPTGPGAFVLIDLGSTNGTFVNGRRIAPRQAVELRDGDRLRLGSTVVLKLVQPDIYEERFQREMFERTVRDGLTGLFNRTYFLHQLGPLAQRSAAVGMGLAVMMLDIDHFKRFNDLYGHAAGDAVLREVANVLRQCTRPEDLVARFGGEEFLVALPSPSLEHALQRGERIRRSLAARPLRLTTTELRITASIGVAYASPEHPRAAGPLISTADLALYRAKERGRNRVLGAALTAASGSESQVTAEAELPPFPDPAAGTAVPGLV